MFEVRCLVGDKSLHKVLHALKNLTLEPPVTLPVSEAEEGESPTLSPSRNGNGRRDSVPILKAMIAQNHLTKVSPAQLRNHLVDHGYSRNAYSHALNKMLDEGFLKKSKTEPNTYEVING